MSNGELHQRILIADDDPGIRGLLCDVFEEEGYTAEPAEHGGEVLAKLTKNHSYDLLIMDVRMPGQDGLTVLEQLRKNGITIPVIMMTAHGTSSTAIRTRVWRGGGSDSESGLPGQAVGASQSSALKPSTRSNSPRLLVTTIRPRLRAWPAMSKS